MNSLPGAPAPMADAKTRAASRNEMEYHQARVLILLHAFAKQRNRTFSGLTKLAKLDFLLRYPNFMERMLPEGVDSWAQGARPSEPERKAVESRMIRYKYGPWDDRYYPIIGALVGRGLLEFRPQTSGLAVRLTSRGRRLARELASDLPWSVTAARADMLYEHFDVSGNRLKEAIYSILPDAIDRPWRSEI